MHVRKLPNRRLLHGFYYKDRLYYTTTEVGRSPTGVFYRAGNDDRYIKEMREYKARPLESPLEIGDTSKELPYVICQCGSATFFIVGVDTDCPCCPSRTVVECTKCQRRGEI